MNNSATLKWKYVCQSLCSFSNNHLDVDITVLIKVILGIIETKKIIKPLSLIGSKARL